MLKQPARHDYAEKRGQDARPQATISSRQCYCDREEHKRSFAAEYGTDRKREQYRQAD